MAPAHAPDHGGYDKAVLLVGDDHRDLLADGVMVRAIVGGFDPGLGTSEDFDWLLRAREGGADVVRTPETALLYRW